MNELASRVDKLCIVKEISQFQSEKKAAIFKEAEQQKTMEVSARIHKMSERNCSHRFFKSMNLSFCAIFSSPVLVSRPWFLALR
jgi:hypothetical protein